MSNIFDLSEKVAVVTGGAGLIGKEHCKALRNAGAKVYLAELNEEVAKETAQALEVECLAFDVTKREEIRAARDKVLAADGRIDVLVNNAAINDKFENPAMAAEQSKFENYPLEMWERMMNANVNSVFLMCQEFGPTMVKQGKGSIINVASTYGVVAPDQSLYKDEQGNQMFYKSPAYPTNKAAVIGLTRFLAAYWGESGVRVNCLSPGGVFAGQDDHFVKNYSEKTPLRRMAEADDYQGALVYLASDASAYATGSNVMVDGGFTIC